MKYRVTFLILLSCLFSTSAFALFRGVSQEEALSVVQRCFSGRDVDYFLLEGNSNHGTTMSIPTWTFFVDAEPMKGWEHECYVCKVPRMVNGNAQLSPRNVDMESRSTPPSGNYVPLSVTNRYDSNANIKPVVIKTFSSNDAEATAVAQRTYAIILSGGIRAVSNYERYWNDCSFIYQTLVNKYGVPKENIYPIMSDGSNPGEDMRCTAGGFQSQPLDLDFDGVPDIELAATKANVQATLSSLENALNEDDHLLFYVIDHGGSDDDISSSYICLWNGETLADTELAEMLEPFCQKYANVNVVLGQCYSGGFIDDLTKTGCVVSAASTGSEPSWACSDIPYDEFVYQWTCAVNGADHRGVALSADSDYNHRVTMLEAFEYAKAHDRRKDEHPQYVSSPISVGEDLAFNHLAPAVDLYLKDNEEDTGKEPNFTTELYWSSPSIWVRNFPDGVYEHENPYYSFEHQSATVYVRVFNRGKKTSQKGDYYVHAYWAKASTGFVPSVWKGEEVDENFNVTGFPLTTPAVIDPIAPGKCRDIKFNWSLPDCFSPENNGTEKHHFCLLAQILDTHLHPNPSDYSKLSYDIRKSNDDAQKNVSIIAESDLSKGVNVYVRNVDTSARKYSLELVPRTPNDEAIYSMANIEMKMSRPIFDAWESGGSQGVNINRAPAISPTTVEFTSKDSRLEAVSMVGRQFDKVGLKFNFRQPSFYQHCYTLDLIQRNEDGEIIGGETFVVKTPDVTMQTANIVSAPQEDGNTELSVEADFGESVRWEDGNGSTIGEGDTVAVPSYSKSGNNTYHVYVLSEDGKLSTGAIDLGVETGIEKVSTDDQGANLSVSLRGNALENSSIVVSSVASGDVVLSRSLDNGESLVSLDVSTLSQGVYAVTYTYKGTTVDSAKFVKQ